MHVKISSVASVLPDWYCPDEPGFNPPDSWTGARLRITVPVGADAQKDLDSARKYFTEKYPGAHLMLVPEYHITGAPDSINITGTDEQLLERYFSGIDLPEHVTAGQLTAYLKKYLPSASVFGIPGLTFEGVRAENVLSFETCEWDLTATGLTLITGRNEDWDGRSNGAGKSSMTTLPFLALFGRTFKEQKHDEWANEHNNLPARVTLKLKLSDNRALEIVRQRRPGLLRIWLDGDEITMGKPEATQNLIERLTGLTWEILTNSVYIGQHEIGSVFGTDKERKELFSRLLGLDRFLDAQDKLRKVCLRIQRSADSIENDISASESALSEARNGLSEIKAELKQAPRISDSDITKLESDIASLTAKYKACAEDLKNIEAEEENISRLIIKHESHVSSLTTRIQMIQKQLDSTRQARGRCIICGNIVSPDILAKYQKELRESISRTEEERKTARADTSAASESYTRWGLKRSNKRNEYNQLGESLNTKQNELNTAKSLHEARTRLKKTLEDKKKRIAMHARVLEIHRRAESATLDEKQFVETCIAAVGRNGLPAYLCASAAPQLNSAAAYYSQLFADGEIGVRFEMNGSDIDVNITNIHGGRNFRAQSVGEAGVAGSITAFAFREILVPVNLLICDEPSEGLDTVNSVMLAKGLRDVVDRFKHVVVISHNTNILGALEPDRHLEVIKTSGISRMVPV
jgi:DNA repair exonuclease SbcCD ATPase subunit